MLKISTQLSLPLEAVTQTFAVLAKRGVGKTYLSSVMAEEMLKAGQPIVAIDPTGAWWGLRSKYPVVVIGGEHADVPLEAGSGEVIAQAIVEHRFPAVIDLSILRKGELIRFMTTFAETLYRLNREALHLFVDEADAVAPQGRSWGSHGKDESESRMLGAMEDIVRRGRKRGIGCTLITQRPAVLNKNVLTQCETLVAMRLVHPKDVDAVKEWVNVHADPAIAKEMIASLPSLPIGTAWFWSPGFLDVFKKVAIRERETFDSGATPKPGEAAKRPKQLASIDVNALGEQIRGTIERAKQDDPRELRKQVAELRTRLEARPAADPAEIERARAEERVRFFEEFRLFGQAIDLLGQFAKNIKKLSGDTLQDLLPFFDGDTRQVPAAVDKYAIHRDALPKPAEAGTPTNSRSTTHCSPSTLPKGEALVLRAIAQYRTGANREQLTVLTGYKRSSRDSYLQRLSAKGLVQQLGDNLVATEAGIASLGPNFERLPTGRALRDHWLRILPEGEGRVLGLLIRSYPEPADRDWISEEAGYKRSSRDSYLQRLSARKLVTFPVSGMARASDELFEGSK